nr:MAG TPA: hypothetical protein [Caudoviricetes sp.]
MAWAYNLPHSLICSVSGSTLKFDLIRASPLNLSCSDCSLSSELISFLLQSLFSALFPSKHLLP